MPRIEFLPSGKAIDISSGATLKHAATAAGVEIESPCGEQGTCGKCLVRVASGTVNTSNTNTLTQKALDEGYRLACTTTVGEENVAVEIIESLESKYGQFVSEDETNPIPSGLTPRRDQLGPSVKKLTVEVPVARQSDGLGDAERLIRAVKKETKVENIEISLRAVRLIAEVLRKKDGLVTVTLANENERTEIISVEPGDHVTDYYGISVDIGTTTVAVQIVNLNDGKIVTTLSGYNDQISCGGDIISRINYGSKPERLQELKERVLGTINGLVGAGVKNKKVDEKSIFLAQVSGNTTMIHLLLGLPPEHIRLAPYTPTVLATGPYRALDIGIKINPDAKVRFSPHVGSYVGGDITAGLLCTSLGEDGNEMSLYIDIGTNGEIVVGNDEILLGAACSAGPAFEGGGVACGMRAAPGAINSVDVDNQTGLPTFATIGDAPPRGICGSGMISLIADLFRKGWVDPLGKFDRDRPSSAIVLEGNRARYLLVRESESATGLKIFIDEIDIENIIRAKAAIYSACSLMLSQIETSFKDLSNIYIAGGFGSSLDLQSAIVIGMLADLPQEKVHFMGNASLFGSYLALVSPFHEQKMHALATRMTYIDLSDEPGYMDQYTAALFLPHTDLSRF